MSVFVVDKHGGETRKIQPDKVDGYLKIWDLRVGWNGSGYERGRERTLQQIAEEVKKPVSTIFSGYEAAFGYISGHVYNPELWLQLFAFLKFHRALGYANGRGPGVKRWISSGSHEPIPSSVLSAGQRQSFVEYTAVGTDDLNAAELETDIRDLIERGLTAEQIAARLHLDNIEAVRAPASGPRVFPTAE